MIRIRRCAFDFMAQFLVPAVGTATQITLLTRTGARLNGNTR